MHKISEKIIIIIIMVLFYQISEKKSHIKSLPEMGKVYMWIVESYIYFFYIGIFELEAVSMTA